MTIDEAIKHAREVAEEQRKICETHIFFDNVTYEEFYADDTEIIEEALYKHKLCAEEHQQLVDWLEELKALRIEAQIQNEGLTDAYLLGKYDGIKQGRADQDAENEISYDVGYEKGRADAKKEINEIMDMDVPISNILYEIDKWLKEQKQ